QQSEGRIALHDQDRSAFDRRRGWSARGMGAGGSTHLQRTGGTFPAVMTDRDFDVVIAGAGLGGLECAVILASEGYKVCVLEKNHQLGGSLQVFSRNKTVFDTGVHYIG